MDDLKFLLSTLLLVGGSIYGLLFIDQAYKDHACDKYSKITGREVRYEYWTGCFAKNKEGKFVYWKEFVQVEGKNK